MMPVLMAYGYGQEDLEILVEDCVNLVSWFSTRRGESGHADVYSCRVMGRRTIRGYLQYTRPRSDDPHHYAGPRVEEGHRVGEKQWGTTFWELSGAQDIHSARISTIYHLTGKAVPLLQYCPKSYPQSTM